MANRIASSLLLLGLLDVAQISNALHLGVDLLVALFGNLIVDHVALGLRVLYSALLLQGPGRSHVQIGSIQVVLAHLVVVVKNRKLIMLLRLEAELDRGVDLPTAASRASLWTGLAVVALLNVFSQVGTHVLDDLTCDALLLLLRGNQLLVEGILFLANGVDAVKVVHVADGAGAAPGHLKVKVALPHGRGVHRRDLLSHVPAVIARAVLIDSRMLHLALPIATPVGAASTADAATVWLRSLLVVEVGRLGRWILLIATRVMMLLAGLELGYG